MYYSDGMTSRTVTNSSNFSTIFMWNTVKYFNDMQINMTHFRSTFAAILYPFCMELIEEIQVFEPRGQLGLGACARSEYAMQ